MKTIKIDRSFLSKAQFDLAVQYFTSTFTQNPQPVVVDVSVDGLPEEYIRLTKAPALDAIRADLEAGKELPFARFGERGNSIRIK